MQKAIIFFILLGSVIITLFLISDKGTEKIYPVPTSGTMIKTDMEEKNLTSNRHDWIEAMHRTEPGVDWRKIEYRNSMEKQEKNSFEHTGSRNGEIEIEGGLLTGEWIERGSNNQAGSVFDLDYDPETNELFLVSAGGSIFKTDYYLQYWEVVNDRFKFNPGLLKFTTLDNGNKRLLALIGKEPHYSDDRGATWTSANAYQADNWGQVKDAFLTSINGSDVVLLLAKTSYWNDFDLYASSDNGESYQIIHSFNTSDGDNLAMTHVEGTGEIYVIEQTSSNISKIFTYNDESKSLKLLKNSSPLAFGSNGRGNLAGVQIGMDTMKLFSYNGSNELHYSIDTGTTWNYLSVLPERPWEVRLYVSTQNPDLLLIGAVECYRSLNGGESWNRINGWAEYYGDVQGKLHADIMEFDEFTDQDGNTFVAISNHGGLSVSYDNTITNQNIGLFDLNVSQYYSVRTSPSNPSFIMAGSQDQGLQRGILHGKNTANLEQVISGDYGHNVFTDGGNSFWTVYPGGWVSHYSNPELGYLDASWELNSNNETVWIPPLIAGPDPALDQVILAGGELNGGYGSYLIKLSYQNGWIQKEQLPFNFHASSDSEISAIAISGINRNNWYVATNNGYFYYSTDEGQSFTKANNTVPGSHYLYGACILPSTLDENTVYLSGSGYSTAGVQKSVDGGKNFGAMTNGLPNTMVFGIAANADESLIFAATEAGPYIFIKEEGKWYDLAEDIAPTQSYWSVEYIEETKTARFGTYGRGVWDFVVASGTNTGMIVQDVKQLDVYPNPASDYIRLKINESFEQNSTVEIFDLQGRLVNSVQFMPGGLEQKLDISSLESGNYVVRLNMDKSIYTGKFIKK